jgi:drug/metabolite transporter (DMT)-like permease
MNIIPIFIVLLAELTVGFSHTFAKLALNRMGELWFQVFRVLPGVAILGLLLIFSRQSLACVPVKYIFLGALSGVMAPFLVNLFYFKGLKLGELSIMSPLSNCSPMFAWFFAILLLNEQVTLLSSSGLILILTGVFILSFPFNKKKHFTKELKHGNLIIWLAIGSAALMGSQIVFSKFMLSRITPIQLTFLQNSTCFIGFGLIALIHGKPVKTSRGIGLAAMSGILVFGIGNLLLYVAMANLNATIVSSLMPTGMVFSVMFAFFILKEKIRPIQYVASAVIFIGVVLLTLGS